MYLRFISCVIGLLFAIEAKPLSVQLSSPSAILVNAETGQVLYAKNEHERKFPGSTTKIATALYILEKKGARLNEIATISKDAVRTVLPSVRLASDSKHPSYRLETDGTMAWIRPGEKLTFSTLLYGLLLPSGNDAANALAESTSGSVSQFMDELNLFLKQKGLLETHFSNPHGLHYDDHWTTASDMAKLTRFALKNATFKEIVKTVRYLKPGTGPGTALPPQYYTQNNRLLKPGPYYYAKAIGVKTGYHWRAGFPMVAAATFEGRTLIAVVLHCAERQHRYQDVIRLFEAAFSEKKISRTLFASESDHFTHRIRGANQELQAILKDDVVLEYYPAEEPQFRAEIVWACDRLPLIPGELVGHIRCIDGKGNRLVEKPLFASNGVSKQLWRSVLDVCQSHKVLLLALFLGTQVILLLVYFIKKHQKIG